MNAFFRRIAQAARVLFALLVAIACVCGAVALTDPQEVLALEKTLLTNHVARDAAALSKAENHYEKSEFVRARRVLQRLLERLERVRHIDRRANIKRESLALLATTLVALGDTRKAEQAYDALVAFDDRDFDARVARLSFLLANSEDSGLAASEIETMFRQVPEGGVVPLYYESKKHIGSDAGAIDGFAHWWSIARHNLWSLKFTDPVTGESKRLNMRPHWGADGTVRCEAIIGDSAAITRIEIEPHVVMKMASVKVWIQRSDDLGSSTRGIAASEPTVAMAAYSSFRPLAVELPPASPSESWMTLVFEARAHPLVPKSIASISTRKGTSQGAWQFERGAPWQVFFDTGSGFSEGESLWVFPLWRGADEMRLAIEWPDREVIKLRVDAPFPGLLVSGVEAQRREGAPWGDLGGALSTHSAGVTPTEDGGWATTGKDPFWVFNVASTPEDEALSLRLQVTRR